MQALAYHGLTIVDAKKKILGLVSGNYDKGPKQDLDPNRPGEIKKIREQYGLVKEVLPVFLTGEIRLFIDIRTAPIPDKAHNSLLLFLRDPENMRTYLLENEVLLDEKQKIKLLKTIEKLERDSEYYVQWFYSLQIEVWAC